MKVNGYAMYHNGTDYFFATNRKIRSNTLAKEIIEATNNMFSNCIETIGYILPRLYKATFEIKELPSGREMYSIDGDTSCICGIVGEPGMEYFDIR